MKPFKISEIIGIVLIFALLAAISYPNFVKSFRRARDVTRKNDLGAMAAGLDKYFIDFGRYPISDKDGNILGCLKDGTTPSVDKKGRLTIDLRACRWGLEPLVDLTPGSSEVYLNVIPADPSYKEGLLYKYFSDGKKYQIYNSLEGHDEAEFDPKVEALGIDCGSRKCNMGKASGDGPVDISFEEWTRQIEEAALKAKRGM